MANRKNTFLHLLALTAIAAVPAFAQLDSGTFSGRVTDASGALVPNAAVTVTQTETNFTSDTKTNTDGLFRISSLRPGPYRLEVKAPGFKSHVREGLDLHVGDNQEINVNLEVGAAAESIRVTAEAAQLQTESSAGGASLDGTYLQQLPLYQRYVEAAFFLLPNIDIQGFGYAGNLQGFHIDGLPDNKIGFFQDGTYAVTNNNGTIYTAQNIQSTVEEVKVLGSVLPAEYGHSGGGAMMAVQRTGTNGIHGEISEFGRVGLMQQRKYFDAYKYGQPQPGFPNGISELFQQPNATLSGPIYLPKIYNGKNKTFFVFAVERVIEKQGKVGQYTVPDAAMLSGDFSFAGHLAPGAVANPIYDPATTRLVNGVYIRDPFPGNIIPAARISPVAKKLIALNPFGLPNADSTYGTTGPSNNFNGTYLKKYFSENYTGRIDHQFSPNTKIFGNWLYKSIYQRTPNPQINNPIFDGSLVAEHDYDNTATFGLTKILSPTLVMEARAGYNRFEAAVVNPFYGTNIAGLLGIPNANPALLPGNLPLSLTANGPSEQVIENFTIKDDFTWVRNTHSFKFGYDMLHSRQNNYSLGSNNGTVNNPTGSYTFDTAGGLAGNCVGKVSGGSTCPSTGGISFASFLLGDVSSATFGIPTASWLPRDNVHSFFFQDDWKFSPKLTLNLGIRWVMESPWHTKYGQFSQFDRNATDPVTGLKGAITHPGGNITNREWQAPEPRIGLAWHPKEKLVVRSGFAFMHLDLGLAPSQLTEYSISSTQNNPQSGNPTPIYNISQGPNPIVFSGLTSQGTQPYLNCNTATVSGATVPACSGRTTTFTNPDLKNPYTMTWNLAVQYQLFRNLLIEASYDGSAGVGLMETPNINVLSPSFAAGNTTQLSLIAGNSQFFRPLTNYGDVNVRWNTAHSTYHAGTIHASKRLSSGLTWDSFFTYAKSIDGTGVSSAAVDSHLYKGASSFDRRMRYVGNFSYDLPIGRGRTFMNRGGILNAMFGGYTLVWQYAVYSGNPLTFTENNLVNTQIPSILSPWGNTARPNVNGTPTLREDWQDLGPNRITCGTNCGAVQGNQIAGICCLTNFSEPASFTFGNAGKNTFYSQRGIGASLSARKEFTIREQMKFQIRADFQNPFKWYNWGNPTVAVDLKNVTNGAETGGNNFGKWPTGNEATTVADGGVPMINGTLRLVW